jgi:Xaa-Pro aminopeptidase
MLTDSLAIFNSNDIYPISADSAFSFKQHSDIFYLSGIDQEESVLLIHKNVQGKISEVLFVKKTNEHIAVWEGHKLTQAEAQKISGINQVYWLLEFETQLKQYVSESKNLYINTNEHARNSAVTETREDRFIKKLQQEYPNHTYQKSNPLLHQIRAVKEIEEIELIQQACIITEKGFRRILPFVKPDVWEYEIEAEFIHEFIKNRSNGFAYTPLLPRVKMPLFYITHKQPKM